MRLDLDALALHDRIEHDASLVHADTPPGDRFAPVSVDPELLRSFLVRADSDGGISVQICRSTGIGTKSELGSRMDMGMGMSLEGLARLRVDREADLAVPLNRFHSEVGKGEVALCWLLLKREDGRIPASLLAQWFGEERLPDDWILPVQTLGLRNTLRTARRVSDVMKWNKKN